jgi:hypothetical protein
MNQQDLERFETEVAEIVGAMKELFKEFEKRLGEVVSAQRVASSEARAEGAQISKDLHELGRSARIMVVEQRDLLARIEREWQLRIDHNAQRAGEVQAQAFGESIARGLQEQLAELAADVKSSMKRFTWKSSLQWVLGIAIAIPLTVAVCVTVFRPHVEPIAEKPITAKLSAAMPVVIGLTADQTREAVSKLSLCQVTKTYDWHACIEVDTAPRMGLSSVDKPPRVAVRGM